LKNLLNNEEDLERKAILNSEIAVMHKEMEDMNTSKKYFTESLELYQEIFKKTPIFKFEKEIEEIEKELKNIASKKT